MIIGIYLAIPFVGNTLKNFSIQAIKIPLCIIVISSFILPTINNVNITWCQSRGLIINIENSFPDHASEALYREYVCSVGIEDVFFSKEECLEEANKYIKSTKNKKLKIVEKVQPQRNVWEKRIKKWNIKNSFKETKYNDDLIESNINEMML